MGILIRAASLSDLSRLIDLMRGYYRDDGLSFEPAHGEAMRRLLREPQWGRVYLLECDAVAVAYVAVCIGFSLELGGNDAFVDEVFVLPDYRRRGFARQLLEFAANDIATLGVCALHLEVDQTNESAQQLYASLGYDKRDRYFVMTKRL